MKIQTNIEKKHLIALVAFVLIVSLFAVTIANPIKGRITGAVTAEPVKFTVENIVAGSPSYNYWDSCDYIDGGEEMANAFCKSKGYVGLSEESKQCYYTILLSADNKVRNNWELSTDGKITLTPNEYNHGKIATRIYCDGGTTITPDPETPNPTTDYNPGHSASDIDFSTGFSNLNILGEVFIKSDSGTTRILSESRGTFLQSGDETQTRGSWKPFYITPYGTASDTKFAIDAEGDVGIGTKTPSEKLEVDGNIIASGTICNTKGCVGDSSGGSSSVISGGILDVKQTENGVLRLIAGSTGNYLQSGDETQAQYSWRPFYIGAYKTGGDVKLAIDADGNVGIGTKTPSKKLEVDGDVKVSGKLSLAISDIDMGASSGDNIPVLKRPFGECTERGAITFRQYGPIETADDELCYCGQFWNRVTRNSELRWICLGTP